MVKYRDVIASNRLVNDATAPRVAVFVGGTSGIGQLTIKALVALNTSIRIYMIGRESSKERSGTFINELHGVNSNAEIVWVEGEVSLLADAKRACDFIKRKESRVDLLFLTTGYAPFHGREKTSEGIEITQSLSYYTRMLFVLQLLPLLNAAEAPRVVSVLAGGLERASFDVDDLDLEKPGNFGMIKAQMQYGPMNTMTLEKLARDYPHITFIHSWPGWVNTGNVWRGVDPSSFKGWLVWLFLDPLIGLFSFSDDESGQRYLFQCTSALYGGRGVSWQSGPGLNSWEEQGNGLFLVNYNCDCTTNTKVLALLRTTATAKVWEHTKEVLAPYL